VYCTEYSFIGIVSVGLSLEHENKEKVVTNTIK
jgi:hypothetical protein